MKVNLDKSKTERRRTRELLSAARESVTTALRQEQQVVAALTAARRHGKGKILKKIIYRQRPPYFQHIVWRCVALHIVWHAILVIPTDAVVGLHVDVKPRA